MRGLRVAPRRAGRVGRCSKNFLAADHESGVERLGEGAAEGVLVDLGGVAQRVAPAAAADAGVVAEFAPGRFARRCSMMPRVSFIRSVVWFTTATRSRWVATSKPGVKRPAKRLVEFCAHRGIGARDDGTEQARLFEVAHDHRVGVAPRVGERGLGLLVLVPCRG
jgi:hypothetical protein